MPMDMSMGVFWREKTETWNFEHSATTYLADNTSANIRNQYIWEAKHIQWENEKNNKNAMVTTQSMYIKKWWCMTPCILEIGERRFITLKVVLKKRLQKCFGNHKELFYDAQWFTVTNKNDLMTIWIPKVLIIEVSPRRQTNVLFQNMFDHPSLCTCGQHSLVNTHKFLGWHSDCLEVSARKSVKFPAHRVCCIVAATPWVCPWCMTQCNYTTTILHNGTLNAKAGIMCWYSITSRMSGTSYPSCICQFEDTLAQLKRRFLREIFCAKGTTSGNKLDQPQVCAGMGKVVLQMIHTKS